MHTLKGEDFKSTVIEQELASSEGKKLTLTFEVAEGSLYYEVLRKHHMTFRFDTLGEAIEFYNNH